MVYEEVLRVPSLHPFYSVFIEPLQGAGTMAGSVDIAIKHVGFLLKIQD